LAKYKEDFNIKNPRRSFGLTPQIDTTEAKQKVDKILESFKKRVTYKKNYYRSTYIKEVNKRYNESDIKKSFSDLLKYTNYMNQNIVAHFVTNMVKDEDLKKILSEAEYGFEKKNALDTGINLFNSVYNFFDKIFGDKWEDIKFKLDDKGYFSEIYNENINNTDPNLLDLKELRDELLSKIDETCTYIEKVLIEEIEKTKVGFTLENIKKFLETNEK
jgi:arsenate reductase-like glutaredoxin family protein